MALVLADRVLETTTTTGSGTITLAGAEPGYQSFSVIGNANQTYYTLTTDTDWEVGIGTYTASGTTLSRDTVLASSNSGNRITLPAGSKKVFVTYPAEKSVNFDVSGNITALSGVITNVGYPSADSDAATKLYVDTLAAQGITYHTPVKYEVPNSTGNLTATYNNGTAGVSATLTNAGTLAAFVPDGVTATISDRVLIYNQTNGFENGVYTVTTVGNGSTAWVLTRATDADTYALKSPNGLGGGDAFYVTSGNTGAGETYLCNNSGVISFGSTAISFVQISAAQVYSAGNGLSLTNTVFSLATPVTVANGGTGTSATPTNGQLLIGNGSGYTLATLTAGSGVSITNSAGSITLTATGSGGTVVEVKATAPLASSGGTSPTISIANSTGTGSVVLDQGATISSATITAGVSAAITTITGTSANITTVSGTTARFSSGAITQLSGTSAGITTVTGTTTTFSSGTITQFGATSATVATISGTNVTYSNGNFTSATVTTVSGTTVTYTSGTITTLKSTSATIDTIKGTSASITTITGSLVGNASTATTASSATVATTAVNVASGGQINAASATITTITGTSSNITTLSGTTVTYSSGTITGLTSTGLRATSANVTTLTGTNLTYTSGTVTTLTSSNVITTSAYGAMSAIRGSYFGYSSGYGAIVIGSTAANQTTCIAVDPVGNASGSFSGLGGEVMFRNAVNFISPNSANNGYNNYGNLTDGKATWTQLGSTSASITTLTTTSSNITTLSGTTVTYTSGTITTLTSASATINATTPALILNGTGTDNFGVKIRYNGSDTHGLHLSYTPNNATAYIDNTYNVTAGQVYGDIYFRQNVAGTMTTRMTIKADGGFVGIGKAPTTMLDVSGTITGTTISDGVGNVRNIPSAGTTKTSPYTLATTDIGEFVTVGSGGSITVPNSTFAAGNAVSIYNDTTGGISINISLSTCYVAGTNTNRTGVTLATRGLATILFISSTQGVISGNVT